jgi:hypothetical protein
MPCSLLNAGNAVNMASSTVNSGTREITVVKVRLLAVLPRRSSRKRSRRVRAVLRQGKCLQGLQAVETAWPYHASVHGRYDAIPMTPQTKPCPTRPRPSLPTPAAAVPGPVEATRLAVASLLG